MVDIGVLQAKTREEQDLQVECWWFGWVKLQNLMTH